MLYKPHAEVNITLTNLPYDPHCPENVHSENLNFLWHCIKKGIKHNTWCTSVVSQWLRVINYHRSRNILKVFWRCKMSWTQSSEELCEVKMEALAPARNKRWSESNVSEVRPQRAKHCSWRVEFNWEMTDG